jgi:MFS family permease
VTEPAFRFVTVSWVLGIFAMSCFGALASLYVRDVLGAEASTLASMGTSLAIGTVVGSAMACRGTLVRTPARVLTLGMAGIGTSLVFIAIVPHRLVALSACFAIGLGAGLMLMAATTLVLGQTPDSLRGRVSSASVSLAAFAQLSALLFAGMMAERVGVKPVLLLSATLLISPLVFHLPRVREVDSFDGGGDPNI